MYNMENALLWQLAGFIICFILLFYFTAKYRAALAAETPWDGAVADLTVRTVAQPTFTPRGAVVDQVKNASGLEVADLKEKVKELHYRLEEMKLAQEKTNAELGKLVARMEKRLSTFEQEYVNKLQPTLLSLIEELESIKPQENVENTEEAK